MRPIETLLLGADLLTFVVLAIPRLHAARWIGGVALIALSLAAIQVLVEGSRWQMAPAYALTGLFVCVWLLQSFAPVGGIIDRIRTDRIVTGIAITLGVIGMGISAGLPAILPVFQLPRPDGPFAIGTVTYHWTDAGQREVFSLDTNAHRELMAQVWYPAKKGSSSSYAPYIQAADAITAAMARLHNLPNVFQHLRYVTTHTAESVPVAEAQASYPVLIYLEGLTGYRQLNTYQVEELASHGYVVVGIDQPGAAATVVFPDGHQIAIVGLVNQIQSLVNQSLSPAEKAPQFNGQTFKDGIIPYFAQDASFTLDQLASLNTQDPQGILTGRLDLQHVGLFGMSLGGMVGAEACLKDPRFKACLMLDVAMTADVVQNGLRQPSMWITRPAGSMRLERQKDGGWAEKDIVQTQVTMREVYDSLPGDGYFVQIPGAFHIDFTDLNYLAPILPIPGISGGPIGRGRAHDIVNAYSVAFFDKHLKGKRAVLLDGPAAQYPEVIFESKSIRP